MFCYKYIEIIYIYMIMSVDSQLSLTQLFIRSSWVVYQHIDQCRVGYQYQLSKSVNIFNRILDRNRGFYLFIAIEKAHTMNVNYFQYCHRKGKEPKCMLQIIIVEYHGYEKKKLLRSCD